MSTEPEDLISPDEEAEMQRNFVMGHGEDVIETMDRMPPGMQEHPEAISPDVHDFLAEARATNELWMRQNGIGLTQPDVDDAE